MAIIVWMTKAILAEYHNVSLAAVVVVVVGWIAIPYHQMEIPIPYHQMSINRYLNLSLRVVVVVVSWIPIPYHQMDINRYINPSLAEVVVVVCRKETCNTNSLMLLSNT